jgi:glycosyltransferase involved in cell wall biosynthesis
MSGGVSVVICCHNSAKRLPETLRHLAAQQVSKNLLWEIVVIDNASTDDTAGTAVHCWPENSPAPLRVISEPRPGTGNARFRSFSEARYEILNFIDDDNWVTPDWISKVAIFFSLHPEIVVVGGPCKPVFETVPPAWFTGVAKSYALGDQYPSPGDVTDQHGTLLWTAGMSLRRKHLLELAAKGFRFLSCVGSTLPIKRGEDTELCFAIRESGARLYYEPTMVIEHFMPAERLTWQHALKFAFIHGSAGPLLALYLMALSRPPFDTYSSWKKTWIFQMLKTLLLFFRTVLSHPWDCFQRPEGSSVALDFERTVGQLSTVWTLRGQYRKLREEISQARWAKAKK